MSSLATAGKHGWVTAGRWLIAVVILFFFFRRLQADWPAVRVGLATLSWGWLALSLIPGSAYFLFRISAWVLILRTLAVSVTWPTAARVWMQSEAIRYIPGNVWSILGRMSFAATLQTSKLIVFGSMVVETMTLLATAAAVAAVLILPFPALARVPWIMILLLTACGSLLLLYQPFMRRLGSILWRILRRDERPPSFTLSPGGYLEMTVSWVFFAFFHVAVAMALNPRLTASDIFSLAGIAVISWLAGYLSFITPGGLGVREAVMVSLLALIMDTASAILISVISRTLLIIIEFVLVGAFSAWRQPSLIPLSKYDTIGK